MLEKRRRRTGYARPLRPSPPMVLALLAVFVALGGTTYAATNLPAGSVGSEQIKNGAVTEKKLSKNAVTSGKVKDHSLMAKDFKRGQLPAGPRGPRGLQGLPGPGHAATITFPTDATEVTHKLFTLGHARIGGACYAQGGGVVKKIIITAVGGQILLTGESGPGALLPAGASEAIIAEGSSGPMGTLTKFAVFDAHGPSFTGLAGAYVGALASGPCILTAQAAG